MSDRRRRIVARGAEGAPLSRPARPLTGVERMVHAVLLGGVVVSVALMLAGLVLLAVRGGPMPNHVETPGELTHGLVALRPAAYLSLGLIVLIATPFVRVAGSIVAFAREHDRRYVLITSAVLAVMCLSVLLGKA